MSRFAREFRAAEYAREQERIKARSEAFAAIRRAASEARCYDRYAKDFASRGIIDSANRYETWAGVTRQVIRTAIGSEKA